MMRLKHVADMAAGGTPPVDDPKMWAEGGLPWVAITDMTRSPIVLETDRGVTPEGIASKRLAVGEAGTLLFAMYASLGSMAVLGIQATWNQAILGIKPKSGMAEVRFIRYWLEHLRRDLGAIARTNTQDNLNAEQVGNFPFPLMSLSQQQAVADYLDGETARIDALIEKRQRMLEILAERRRQCLTSAMESAGFTFPNILAPDWSSESLPSGWRAMHLNQCLRQLTNGFVGPTRDILQESGVPYVQSLHIKRGRIDFARSPYFVAPEWHQERPRIHLREGDVLIVQTGDIGQVAVVQPGFGEASCHALQIARVRPEIVSGPFLGEYLRTPFGYESLLSRATGALHPHLEGGIRDVPVVVPPLDIQATLLADAHEQAAGSETVEAAIEAQLRLMTEHRQALITSAVTGELAVPGTAA